MATKITVSLPDHDHDIDCERGDGTPAISPGWEFKSPARFRADNVAAYRDSVVFSGPGGECDVVDADSTEMLELERDVLAILAAIAQHRTWAQEDAD